MKPKLKPLTEQDEQIINNVIDDLVSELHDNHIAMLKLLSKEDYEQASLLRDRTNQTMINTSEILSNIIGIDMEDKVKEQNEVIKKSIEDNIENINKSKK